MNKAKCPILTVASAILNEPQNAKPHPCLKECAWWVPYNKTYVKAAREEDPDFPSGKCALVIIAEESSWR